MTTPNIVPARYTGTANDYRFAKIDTQGPERTESYNIAIPSGTVVGAIVGLVPFRRNAGFGYGSTILCDALGAGVTLSLGYIYDNNVTYTNNTAAFLAATVANTAGLQLVPNVGANVTWRAPIGTDGVGADGWIVAVVGGANTAAAGNINVQITTFYDQP